MRRRSGSLRGGGRCEAHLRGCARGFQSRRSRRPGAGDQGRGSAEVGGSLGETSRGDALEGDAQASVQLPLARFEELKGRDRSRRGSSRIIGVRAHSHDCETCARADLIRYSYHVAIGYRFVDELARARPFAVDRSGARLTGGSGAVEEAPRVSERDGSASRGVRGLLLRGEAFQRQSVQAACRARGFGRRFRPRGGRRPRRESAFGGGGAAIWIGAERARVRRARRRPRDLRRRCLARPDSSRRLRAGQRGGDRG